MIIGARFRRKENDTQDEEEVEEDGPKALSPGPHASITESLQMNEPDALHL